jgi:hypothetical protein
VKQSCAASRKWCPRPACLRVPGACRADCPETGLGRCDGPKSALMLAAPVLGRQGFLAIARRQIGGEPRQDLLRPNSFGESLDPRSYDSSPQRRRGTPGTGRTVAVDIGRTTSAWHDPVCVWPWLRPSLMSLTWRKVPANAHLLVDGPECTGPAEWRTAIAVSKMNIAFHDQIGHEMSIWSISRLCSTVRERADFR